MQLNGSDRLTLRYQYGLDDVTIAKVESLMVVFDCTMEAALNKYADIEVCQCNYCN